MQKFVKRQSGDVDAALWSNGARRVGEEVTADDLVDCVEPTLLVEQDGPAVGVLTRPRDTRSATMVHVCVRVCVCLPDWFLTHVWTLAVCSARRARVSDCSAFHALVIRYSR